MFKLKFHASSCQVEEIGLNDGSFTKDEIAAIKPQLEKIMIENPCLTFSQKQKAGYFENVPQELVNNIAFISDPFYQTVGSMVTKQPKMERKIYDHIQEF